MFDPALVKIRGPLAPYVRGFWLELQRQGYLASTGSCLLRLASHISRWLEDRVPLSALDDDQIAAFVAHRRRQGYRQYRSPRALKPLLGYLRGIGAVPPARPVLAKTPLERLLCAYAAYLVEQRGLAAGTIRGYVDEAGRFALRVFDGGHPKWAQLRPADITRYVLHEARRWSIGYSKLKVTALRSLLRFLHVRGELKHELAGCVPAVAGWRLSGLPKALDAKQVRCLLNARDTRPAFESRDAAIIRLLLRLGLRAGEAATLELDDIDWRAGELIVRGKGRRESRMPLPHDVGAVLAAYLRRGRPQTSTRAVFVRGRAPFRGLSTSGILAAVRRALAQAGVARCGAHVLRHTAATRMLGRGASLPEIGHVLRHRHVDTTAIYAKVDFAALRTVVQPWPGGVR